MTSPPRRPGRLRAVRRWLLRAVGWTALLLTGSLVLALALAVQGSPRWPQRAAVSPVDIEQAKHFLRRNDPRRPAAGPLRTLSSSEQEANLMLDQLARRVAPGASARLALDAGSARLQMSLPMPRSPFTAWLNIDATLRQTPGLPAIERLQVGRLPVPAWVAARGLPHLTARLKAMPEAALALDMARHVRLMPARLEVVYEWRDDGLQRVLGTVLPPADLDRLHAYAQALAQASAGGGRRLALGRLLPPVFTLARERTEAGGDALAENRAALLALTLQATGRRLPGAAVPQLPPKPVTLAGREDFAQHFLISAVVALEGGGPLADAIGVYKELADMRDGSGFSFNDIAADRAGTRLGLRARHDPRTLQQQLAQGVPERELMPDVADLPEFLSERAFVAAYGGLDAPPYRRMLADIERRLDALPLLRTP